MLTIVIPAVDFWDEKKEEFFTTPERTLTLEHSLVSLSKWESKWHKPFLTKDPKSYEESMDYIRYMALDEDVDPDVYNCITDENMKQIEVYMGDPMTATWFNDNDKKGKRGRQQVTSELIYYWMFSLGIPIECETWHLNRLITLIQVFNAENQPRKKMSMQERIALNKARRNQSKKKG